MCIRFIGLLVFVGVSSASIINRRQVVYPHVNTQPCDIICDEETAHASHSICDTNGVLYKSSCEYNKAHCAAMAAGEQLSIVSYGACVDMQTSCDIAQHVQCVNHVSIQYPYYYPNGGPVVTGTGSVLGGTTYQKPEAAEKVCGSDKNTYSSVCVFKHTQCTLQMKVSGAEPLTLDHMGECVQDTKNATEIDCSQYITDVPSGIAIETGTNIRPVLSCPRNYHPVCSLEGRTFINDCSLCSYEMRIGKASTTSPTVSAFDGACHNSHNVIG